MMFRTKLVDSLNSLYKLVSELKFSKMKTECFDCQHLFLFIHFPISAIKEGMAEDLFYRRPRLRINVEHLPEQVNAISIHVLYLLES